MSTGTLEYSLTNLSKRFPSPPSSLQTTVTVSFVFQSYTQHTHSDDDPPARLRFNLKWGHRAGFPTLHSGTAHSPMPPLSSQDPYEPYRGYNRGLSDCSMLLCERRWRGEGERDRQDKLQPGEGCQSIGMLSSYLVAAARASARVSGCSCLCHLPI
jgi:hypothetical protein